MELQALVPTVVTACFQRSHRQAVVEVDTPTSQVLPAVRAEAARFPSQVEQEQQTRVTPEEQALEQVVPIRPRAEAAARQLLEAPIPPRHQVTAEQVFPRQLLVQPSLEVAEVEAVPIRKPTEPADRAAEQTARPPQIQRQQTQTPAEEVAE